MVIGETTFYVNAWKQLNDPRQTVEVFIYAIIFG